LTGDLVWAAQQFPGFEHVMTRSDASGFRADSQLVMVEDRPVRVRYLLKCDSLWRFTALTMTVTDSDGERTLSLSATADGRWQTDGTPRPDLDGCIDIDINCTPLTNTLPVRRLTWTPEASHDLSVAYVSVPELTVRPVSQRYTQLDQGRYRYESGAFRTDLPVDDAGLVVDYPSYWNRVAPVSATR
jgi:hypothetical protein